MSARSFRPPRTKQEQNLDGVTIENTMTVVPGHPDWDRMYALNPDVPFPHHNIIISPTETVVVNDRIAWDMGVRRVQ